MAALTANQNLASVVVSDQGASAARARVKTSCLQQVSYCHFFFVSPSLCVYVCVWEEIFDWRYFDMNDDG